ncbi:HMG box-containing protein 4 isoform X1 [Hydra vulgaris]|uniref:HMG box-containing protein 4 isoform X1 n=1 Tax=Hydra vulgaris TaxID=6087 RepID=UPI001F5F4639|nr:HMG box-containing protein 4 isoform X1 [Hydra vulgaris]
MSEKKKFSFEEGHKRETRKSYQQYLKEVSMSKTGDADMDDESIRRSKRTPVPKRGFKLIDDYDSKKTPKKKGKDSLKDTMTDLAIKKEVVFASDTNESADDYEKGNQSEDNEERSFTKDDFIDEPRRSGRVKKPKKFEKDDNSSSTKRGRKKLNEPDLEIKPDPDLETTPKKTASVRTPGSKIDKNLPIKLNDVHQVLSGPELVKLRRKQPVEGDHSFGRTSKKSPLKRKSEIDNENLDSSTLITHKKSKKQFQEENVFIKQELEADESVINHQRSYESYVSKYTTASSSSLVATTNKVTEDVVSHSKKEERVLKKFNERKKDEEVLKKSNERKKEEDVLKKSNEKSSHKSPKNKKTEKLIISFKKNPLKSKFKKNGNSSYQKIESLKEINLHGDSTAVASATSNDIFEEKIITEEVSDAMVPIILPETVTSSLANDASKKRKKKKRNKESNEKIISCEVFSVEDTQISKVKKKKIYKRRNGEKVLVRLIKNYCNRAGQVVKTESILIENTLNNKQTSHQNMGKPISNTNELLCEDPPLDGSISVKEEVTIDSAPLPSKKKVIISQKNKPGKKATKVKSRPANRVVTKNGKVVGKTTKGMKKTGVPTLPDAIQQSNTVSQTYETHTEPKNAYNLFCRKYRSYVKEQYPDADFSEISRKLANLWQMTPKAEKKEHRDKFAAIQPSNEINKEKMKLARLNTLSPIRWSDAEFKYIKESIQKHESFDLPRFKTKHLTSTDLAAHLQLLGESLNSIGAALQEQSTMNVHGAMSVLLDSILCAVAPLSFITSFVPEMNVIEAERQARILDNIAYILPGL